MQSTPLLAVVGIQQGEVAVTTEGAHGMGEYVKQKTLMLAEQIGLADWRESRHVSNGEKVNGIDGINAVVREMMFPATDKDVTDKAETETGKGEIDEEGTVEAGIYKVGIGRETDRETTLGGMALYKLITKCSLFQLLQTHNMIIWMRLPHIADERALR